MLSRIRSFFFFQAEDGIRDLVRSRGLGDVYKRQRTDYANGFKPKTVMTRVGELTFDVPQVRGGGFYPLSLIHI